MMKQEVILVVLMLFCFKILYFASSENVQLFRYTKAECSSSNISVIDIYCFVRAYSRTLTTLNVGGTLIKNYTKVYVRKFLFLRLIF